MQQPSVTCHAETAPPQDGGALAGQVAIVTGGSSGIGLAIATALAAEGAQIAVLARDDDDLRRLREAGHGDADRQWHLASGDVCREADVVHFVGEVERLYGGFDILVSNAGFHHAGAIEDVPYAAWQSVLDTHAGAGFLFARAVFRSWKRLGRHGRVVFVASKAAVAASPGAATYACAKAAQLHLARCLAEEGGPHGIRVNAVLPDGVIRGTGIFDEQQRRANARRHGVAPEALEAFYAQRNALKVSVGPEDVARAVLFLCDDRRSRTITGAALTVDGGLTASHPR
jgi:NAD(P)-dependent dehydrogenase (short-subunit alcohol dehydrogenase family)